MVVLGCDLGAEEAGHGVCLWGSMRFGAVRGAGIGPSLVGKKCERAIRFGLGAREGFLALRIMRFFI